MLGKTVLFRLRPGFAQFRNEKRRLSELLFGEGCDDFRGDLGILQNNRVQIPPERRFNCGHEFRNDIELGDERAGQGGLNSFRIVQTFQYGLRTLGEAFAFFIELLQNFKARFFFGERPLDRDQTFFGLGKKLPMVVQCFFRGLRLGEKKIGVLLLSVGRGARGCDCRLCLIMGVTRFGDRGVEFTQMFVGCCAADRDTGEIVFQIGNPAFVFC